MMWKRIAKIANLPIFREVVFAGFLAAFSNPLHAADIWFSIPQPRPGAVARLHDEPGDHAVLLRKLANSQTDWDWLFTGDTLDMLAPHIQAVNINTGFIVDMPMSQLSDKLARIAEKGIQFVFVAQPVVSTSASCGHTEGYENPTVLALAVSKLRQLKIHIRYLALDGGLFFGHYLVADQACHLSVAETIHAVALTVNAFKELYPDIIVGEILPTVGLTREPDWQQSVRDYRDGLTRETGKALRFFDLDIAWNNPSWKQSVVAETTLARSLGLGIGYIYNGDGDDRSDKAWLDHARRNIAEIEGGLGLQPDRVIFSSWNEFPTHSVGQPLNDTLAGLVLHYMLPGTRLNVRTTGPSVSGSVTDFGAHPLGDFRVELEASDISGKERLPTLLIAGVVPPAARTAIIGIRINTECLCEGLNEIRLGEALYQEDGAEGATHVAGFLPVFRHLSEAHTAGAATVHMEPAGPPGQIGETATILAQPDQKFLLNTAPFRVNPGSNYRFSVPALDLLGNDMFGTICIIWLDAQNHGITRANLAVRPDFRVAAVATTDAYGKFSLNRPSAGNGRFDPARLVVPDQQGRRPASLQLP